LWVGQWRWRRLEMAFLLMGMVIRKMISGGYTA
jgi:hypothetical protein